MKRCPRCNETKDVGEFHRNKGTSDGLTTWCKGCHHKSTTAYRSTNPQASFTSARSCHLRRKYGITPQEFDAKLASQGGGCAICGTMVPGGRGQFHCDHDHDTLENRGILCHGCNISIGHLRDSPDTLVAALRYLLAHGKSLSETSRGALIAALDLHHSGDTCGQAN